MKSLLLAAALAGIALPALAEDMRTVTDHAGLEVTFPTDPQRIVSLHDWTATVMTYELGGNLIASSGRLDKDGSYFVRSGRELYDLTFDDIEMASVHGQLDMEMIAALEPDLIIGNVGDTLEYRDQLASIAPTIMFDPMNGRTPMDNYADLADWVNRTEKFEELKAAYDARIADTKAKLIGDGPAPTYVAIMPNPEDGDIRVFRNYGAQTTVLEDLGFSHLPIMDKVPETEQDASFSAEIMGELNADYVFTTHMIDRDENLDTMMAQFDQIAPGYRDFLTAVKTGRFISMSRFHVYPTTFAAMNYTLDELAKIM